MNERMKIFSTSNSVVFVGKGARIFLAPGRSSGVARGGDKWGHAPWGAGLGGAPPHFLQPFKNAF